MSKMKKLQKKLNRLVENGIDKNCYKEILKVSQQLDKYIAKDLFKQCKKRAY